jgi:hypothetical protein
MFKLKIGTLIWDHEDNEWGIITAILDEEYYNTSWAKSIDQALNDFDLELDRFEIYEV